MAREKQTARLSSAGSSPRSDRPLDGSSSDSSSSSSAGSSPRLGRPLHSRSSSSAGSFPRLGCPLDSSSSYSSSSKSSSIFPYPESDVSPTTHGVDASPNTHGVDASPNTHDVNASPNTPGADASPTPLGADASPSTPGADASPQISPTTPGTDACLIKRVANRARRYTPGPMALSEIRPFPRQTALVKANLRFENFVDRLVHEFAEDVQRHVREFYAELGLNVPLQLPPPCLEIREEVAAFVVCDNKLRAFCDKRKTITPKDRQLGRRFRGKPYQGF